MRIITRDVAQIRKGDGRPFITFYYEGIYFTKSAIAELEIKNECRINFIQDENKWSFYCHSDEEGFLLKEYGSGYRLHSQPLYKMVKKSLKMEAKQFSFYIKSTGEEINGHTIIKILTDHIVE